MKQPRRASTEFVVLVEARDRQVEDVLVEIPHAPLPLEPPRADLQRGTVQEAAETAGFPEVVGRRPIELMADDRLLVPHRRPLPAACCRAARPRQGYRALS